MPNKRPIILGPGAVIEAMAGEPVRLDGSRCFDPDGGQIAYYIWRTGQANDLGVRSHSPFMVIDFGEEGVFDCELNAVDDEGTAGLPARFKVIISGRWSEELTHLLPSVPAPTYTPIVEPDSPDGTTGRRLVVGGHVYELREDNRCYRDGHYVNFTTGRIGSWKGNLWAWDYIRRLWARYDHAQGGTVEQTWGLPYWPPYSTLATGGVILDPLPPPVTPPVTPPDTPPVEHVDEVWTLDAGGHPQRDGALVEPSVVATEVVFWGATAAKTRVDRGYALVEGHWQRYEPSVTINGVKTSTWVRLEQPGVNYGRPIDRPGSVPTVDASLVVAEALPAHVADPANDLEYLGMFRLQNGSRSASKPWATRMGFSYGRLTVVRYPGDSQLYVAVTNSNVGDGAYDDQITLFAVPGSFASALEDAPVAKVAQHWTNPWQSTRQSINHAGPVCYGIQYVPALDCFVATSADKYNVAGFDDPNVCYLRLAVDGRVETSGPYRTQSLDPKRPAGCGMTRGNVFLLPDGRLALHGQIASGNAASPWGANFYEIKGRPEFGGFADALSDYTKGDPAPASIVVEPHIFHSIKHKQRRNPDYLRCEMLSRWGDGSQPFGSFPYQIAKGALHYPGESIFSSFDIVTGGEWLSINGREALMFVGSTPRGHVWYGSPDTCAHGLSGRPMTVATGDAASEHRLSYMVYDPQALDQDPLWRPMSDMAPTLTRARTFGELGAIKQDRETGLVFISQVGKDTISNRFEPQPVVHVFKPRVAA